jgi:hypothetical protein
MSSAIGAHCEIVIATTVGEAWSEWFDGFEVRPEGSTSRLVGTIVDQAALHGILSRLRDLALPILDVHVTPQSATEKDG